MLHVAPLQGPATTRHSRSSAGTPNSSACRSLTGGREVAHSSQQPLQTSCQHQCHSISTSGSCGTAHDRSSTACIDSAVASSAACSTSGCGTAAAAASWQDAVLRYHYYVHLGLHPSHVAPFREEWLMQALALVPGAPPPGVSQVRVAVPRGAVWARNGTRGWGL